MAPAKPEGRAYAWFDFVSNWDLVVIDVATLYGLDLYDPAVLARPWPGVRTLILGLLEQPRSILRAHLGGD